MDRPPRILQPEIAYTFSDIFKLKPELEFLLGEFGYSLNRTSLDLPRYPGELDRLDQTFDRIEEMLAFVDLTNETARREILISPVVTDVVHYTHAQLRIEYPLKVSPQLQGNLDYLLRGTAELLVIEAKQEDVTNGFAQLAAELIALDQWGRSPDPSQQRFITGAVSTGVLWQFGLLDRQEKLFKQGTNSYRVPEDLETLLRILVGALNNGKSNS
jgi:hypothetical protein